MRHARRAGQPMTPRDLTLLELFAAFTSHPPSWFWTRHQSGRLARAPSQIGPRLEQDALESGLVLADALEEAGYRSLGEHLRTKTMNQAKQIIWHSPQRSGAGPLVPDYDRTPMLPRWRFLLARVAKALLELEQRDGGRQRRARTGLARRLTEDPEFVRAFRFWRAYGMDPSRATAHARAERFADRWGWDVRFEPEVDRYEDVYGEPSPDPDAEWSTAILVDDQGRQIDGLGFVDAHADHERRYQRASMSLEHMGRRRPR